jgi:hypothetical protein
VRANRVYELVVRRGGRGPAFLSGAGRVDTVEIVEVDSGEVALFWELGPADARRLARGLRGDLAQLEAEAFMTRWRRYG